MLVKFEEFMFFLVFQSKEEVLLSHVDGVNTKLNSMILAFKNNSRQFLYDLNTIIFYLGTATWLSRDQGFQICPCVSWSSLSIRLGCLDLEPLFHERLSAGLGLLEALTDNCQVQTRVPRYLTVPCYISGLLSQGKIACRLATSLLPRHGKRKGASEKAICNRFQIVAAIFAYRLPYLGNRLVASLNNRLCLYHYDY